MPRDAKHDAATLESVSVARPGVDGIAPVDALVVLWCRDDPSRTGEVLLLPVEDGRRSYVFGRGEAADGRRERLRLVRQRPGEIVEAPALETPRLSRAQLVLRPHADGGIHVDNEGKRELLVEGNPVASARVRPGQIVEIRGEMVLLCTRRPATLPPLRIAEARLVPAFGEADAFGYVGESPAAWRLRGELAVVARRNEHVLILGESGVGKEIVAQAIHAMSARAGRKLVARNAATVPAGIIDAELFGNAASYPNSGMPERPGLVGEADGSTLYLDEIGELPPELQTHLLRLLDGGDYQRLGESRRRVADLRFLGATNRPVEQLRSDVAARFAVRLNVPSLHERREDVPLIARHLLRRILAEEPAPSRRSLQGAPRELSKDLVVALVRHLYATHVREMYNVIYRAYLDDAGVGGEVDLGDSTRRMLGLSAEPAAQAREVTREAIVEALARHGGVREKVWRDLGLANRYVLKRLMSKYGIADEEG